jgi:hypothetical protein
LIGLSFKMAFWLGTMGGRIAYGDNDTMLIDLSSIYLE